MDEERTLAADSFDQIHFPVAEAQALVDVAGSNDLLP
jgi:hypothetical protein